MVGNCNLTIGKPIGKAYIKMLLVEDNAAEARFLQEILKGTALGCFTLIHAKRLAEAISLLEQPPVPSGAAEAFDVILLDLTLPDSTGLASLDTLLNHAPSLPIVVLTNTNDNELAIEAVRHGAQDYLFKRQITQEILVRSIHYAIERKQGAEALREANEILELRVQERTAELKATNELLRQEIEWRQQIQERLELAQQAGKIGTFEWSIQANEIAWTAELEALYGLTPGGFAGRYEDWIQTLHPDDRRKIEQDLWQAVSQGKGLEAEFRIRWSTGEIRWIAVKSSLFHSPDGKPQRMIGIHMDITEKKLLEAQFLRMQRLESLGTLASGIAHDLNNILTPILAVAQLLPLKFPDLDDQTERVLNILESSALRGTELIQQILTFARGVEGKRGCLQVNHLLHEIQKIIQQTLPKSIEISTDLPANLWTISGDVTQLHQVFMNLCVNARDAMPQGGSLTITAENVQLDETYARLHLDATVGPYVMITVADTGSGIAPEILHRIFDPFFTTKDLGKGTGLGLSAVLGIVKSHGGFIDVQSEIGQGSRFKVYLPASQATIASAEIDLGSLTGQQELILVVDDEAFICEATKAMLEAHNYRVLTAKDGAEAIALFAEQQHQIRTVLIDMMMPVMDGPATVDVLRRLNPNLHVIAMSGLTCTETIAQTKRPEFQDFLAKPFTTRELLQALQT